MHYLLSIPVLSVVVNLLAVPLLATEPVPWKKHIVDERTPCTVCHDSHGIASSSGSTTGNSHLINFSTSVVFPEKNSGRLEYRDTGMFQGECFLSCHGKNHGPYTYKP